jgi:beta-galactosidase
MHPRYRNWQTDSLPCDLAMVTDVQAYNYRYMYFPGDGRRFPWMTFYQSEAAVATMGQNFFEMDLNKVIGLAYWGAIDYLGESQGWPAKGWNQGVFDIALNPKPKAYYMKSFFKPEENTVHIGIVESKGNQMWNGVQTGNDGMSDHWNRAEGSKHNVVVYTNAQEVELLLNGKSLGKKQNNLNNAKMRNQLFWSNVEYKPGKLVAIARNNGQEACRHSLETTGPAVELVALDDDYPAHWLADGMDLQHVKVVAVDKRGRTVQTADQEVTFSVEGPAEIVGVINGDINSEELTVGNKRRLYHGNCTLILRSKPQQKGRLVVTASAPGLKPVKLKLRTW